MDTVPEQVQKMFNEEYGIKVAYNSKTGTLYYDGEIETENTVSTSAKNTWIKELKKGETSEGKLVFGFQLGHDEKVSTPVGERVFEMSINYGAADQKSSTTFIDLADFDGQNLLGEWVTDQNTTYDSRSMNLGRVMEHEFLGHIINGLNDPKDGDNNTGETVDLVNSYREDIGVDKRKSYTTGLLRFGPTNSSKVNSAFLPNEKAVSTIKNKIIVE